MFRNGFQEHRVNRTDRCLVFVLLVQVVCRPAQQLAHQVLIGGFGQVERYSGGGLSAIGEEDHFLSGVRIPS